MGPGSLNLSAEVQTPATGPLRGASFMSVELLTAVFRSSLPPTQRLVALALADYASPDGSNVYPSVGSVMRRTGLSERAVRTSVRLLREAGVLTQEGEKVIRTPGGEQTIPRYRIEGGALGAGGAADAGPAPRAGKGVQEVPQGGAGGAPKPTTEPRTRTVRDARFDEFWAAYPIKRDKPAARKAWDKAVKDTDPQVIIDAVPAYIDELARTDVKPKYPQGWLSGRRWEDEPMPSGNGARLDDWARRRALARGEVA